MSQKTVLVGGHGNTVHILYLLNLPYSDILKLRQLYDKNLNIKKNLSVNYCIGLALYFLFIYR